MKIICAYTMNLDAVYNVNGIELAKLSGNLKPEAQEKITGLEDLLSALLFCMKEGSGDELPIEHEEVAGIIERVFPLGVPPGRKRRDHGRRPGDLRSPAGSECLSHRRQNGGNASSRRPNTRLRKPERAASGRGRQRDDPLCFSVHRRPDCRDFRRPHRLFKS